MTSVLGDGPIVEQLADGDAGPVLVADFEPFSPDRRLGELLAAAVSGRPVYQIDPVGALSGGRTYVPLPELAARYAEEFLASAPAAGRVFVVSHCSAAPLSLHITELLAASRAVTTILLQPSWPDERLIRQLFAEFQDNLGAAGQPCPDLSGEPAGPIARMEANLREGLAAVAASRGLTGASEVFGELLSRYRAWLSFLLACRNDNDPPVTLETGSAEVKLFTARADLVVPGLLPGGFEIEQLPDQGHGSPGTEKLARLALTEIASR
jgi:hypothetical protein